MLGGGLSLLPFVLAPKELLLRLLVLGRLVAIHPRLLHFYSEASCVRGLDEGEGCYQKVAQFTYLAGTQ